MPININKKIKRANVMTHKRSITLAAIKINKTKIVIITIWERTLTFAIITQKKEQI